MTVFGFLFADLGSWGQFFHWVLVCASVLLILVVILQCVFGSQARRWLNIIQIGIALAWILSVSVCGYLSTTVPPNEEIMWKDLSILSEGHLVTLGLIFFFSNFFIHLLIVVPKLKKLGHEPADIDSLNIYNDWRKVRLECKGGSILWAVLWGLHLACLIVLLLITVTTFRWCFALRLPNYFYFNFSLYS